jgi:hypothetical protein
VVENPKTKTTSTAAQLCQAAPAAAAACCTLHARYMHNRFPMHNHKGDVQLQSAALLNVKTFVSGKILSF